MYKTVGTAITSYFKEISGSDSASTCGSQYHFKWVALGGINYFTHTFMNLTFSYSPTNSSSTSFICLHGSDHAAQKCTTRRLKLMHAIQVNFLNNAHF